MTTAIRHDTHRTNHDHATRHHAVAAEASSIMDRMSHSAVGEEAKALVHKLRESVDALKENALAAQEQIKSGLHVTERAIKHNPWRAVGLAVAGGLVIGYLLRRR